MKKLPHMRTLDECFEEIKSLDPHTAISKYFIRQLAISGKIKCVKSGSKRLINFESLIDYIVNESK